MAHCHGPVGLKNIPEGAKKIVLAGNPNTGKSVFFNYFTGLYVDVSNYPGTTLEISHGRFGSDVIIDTPGVYGISSFNDEERIARDIILSADMVISVVDAVHLERDLFLTQQVIDTGVPVIMALNMVDEAERQGLKVDADLLSDLLGIPVIPTVAVQRKGFSEVKERLADAKTGHMTPGLEPLISRLANRVGSQGEALLVLEDDPLVAERHGLKPENHREEIYLMRRERVNDVIKHVLKESTEGATFGSLLGRWMLKPATGLPILALALYAMYYVIGVLIAGTVVGFTEETIMLEKYEPAVRGIVGQLISAESVLGTILIGEFGLLTMTITYILGLLMPLVIGFYFFLSLFEDSGYLPRIATLVDRLLTGVGLNGRGVIPLILGFGCVTMATITTRLLGSDRERRIAVLLLGLTIPCSAQLGVIAGLLAGVGGWYVALYAMVIFTVLVIIGTIMDTLLPGKSTDLLIDLPPLRLPRLDNVLKKTGTKSYNFLKEAFPLFALGALIISVFQVTGILEFLQNLLAPLTVGWLKLPKEAATAFIMGIVRRDFGAAGLSNMVLTPEQTIAALITITLFVPCIASILIIFKERSKKEAAMIWGASWAVAFLVGGIVSQLHSAFGGDGGYTGALGIILAFFGMTLATVIACRLAKRDKPRGIAG
ncbi:MAG: Ferrous iron transport protein B [Pelotomaculum sp. PtaB.Bin013]|uniref:Ferrous iron transport protein B n=1 Tax=Pelotomaculum isophthalicicum JI TaxID=947010 RepID=A0A9X4H7C6_9FIRM|nr:ferrous iron transport protein B [Pelotomaculum isophthalicicum]MDF9407654.1 ferrous iron transport protein B [Pelotomaculum isophthalicicum JI]OPX83724.1 MAG: Ferrous iron transport protein B [Pelotomaculum sp. PtaB.Bin013]